MLSPQPKPFSYLKKKKNAISLPSELSTEFLCVVLSSLNMIVCADSLHQLSFDSIFCVRLKLLSVFYFLTFDASLNYIPYDMTELR